MDDPRDRLLDAATQHVPFDGWSETTLKAAARDADMPLDEARALFPRGAVDLALAFHRRGDSRMIGKVREADLQGMRYRDKIAFAIRARLAVIPDKETARRGATLFALPIHSADGTRALWGTADAIWEAMGDSSRDGNWYTKRATLSGVYGTTLLFWLGDDSLEDQETMEFIDRRIDDVMQVERMKSAIRANPVGRVAMAGPTWLMSRIRAPQRPQGFPGSWGGER